MNFILTILTLISFSYAKDYQKIETDKAVSGFRYRLKLIQKNNHSIEVVNKREEHIFKLNPGDCYDEDCKTSRERIELRSLNEELIPSTVCYSYSLFIPKDYNEMSPKQTLGQWHDSKYGDLFSNRYEDGILKFSYQYKGETKKQHIIPYSKGSWINLSYKFFLSYKNGFYNVYSDNKLLFTKRYFNFIPKDISSIYLKLGIYRSHLFRFTGKSLPIQSVKYHSIKRFKGKECKDYPSL